VGNLCHENEFILFFQRFFKLAFQAVIHIPFITQGVAPGWYKLAFQAAKYFEISCIWFIV